MSRKLQKADSDTNAIIDAIQHFIKESFRKKGIKSIVITREFAWEVFQTVHKLPYALLISRNPEIEYQGQGRHISSKQSSQQLVIKEVGKYEIKGVSDKKENAKRANIKFTPSKDIQNMLKDVIVNG